MNSEKNSPFDLQEDKTPKAEYIFANKDFNSFDAFDFIKEKESQLQPSVKLELSSAPSETHQELQFQ